MIPTSRHAATVPIPVANKSQHAYSTSNRSVLRRALEPKSWIRIVGGSGQRHYITTSGVELVEQGFV